MCLHPRKSFSAADIVCVLCQPLSHRTHSFDKERTIRICSLALVQTESVSVVAVSVEQLSILLGEEKVIIEWQNAVGLCQCP